MIKRTRRAGFFLTLLGVVLLTGCGNTGEQNPDVDNPGDDTNEPQTENYTVTFDVDGGSEIESYDVEEGAKLVKPYSPTKEGYAFTGWYKDETFSTAWNFASDTVTSDVTLYAKWEKTYTVSELIELSKEYTDKASTDRYYIQATVDEITNPSYGEMNISDKTGTILVYGTYGADGELRYSELDSKPIAGDMVTLYGTIQEYKGTPEIASGWIIDFSHKEEEFDASQYKSVTIADARKEAVDTKILVEGVVAKFTYNASSNPIGFILVDGTSSIYVYDDQIAAQVKEGNKVKIAGSRDNWILDSEKESAEALGYTGCIQISNCTLVENDNNTNEWDTSWIETTTIKNLMDVDVAIENITSELYKVNALVSKQEGTGFTNYYFYDIDGTTGTYTYTQANGKDFSWLDEFDGKICTVYLTVLNYKSTSSGAAPRLLPVKVIDENYKFDLTTTADMVMTYYVEDQFDTTVYDADPEKEMVTSVSNELLGFENATITYTSDNTNVVSFETTTDATIMHVGDTIGTAKVTATVSYETYKATKDFTLEFKEPETYESINVKAAIDTEVGTEITVKGIVGPSLVNRDGFYLMDETGTIAITTTKETLATVNLGDEVILKGNRDAYSAKNGFPGQTCITSCEILRNSFGEHEIPTNTFISGKTLADIVALDVMEDHTTEVYYIDANVKEEGNQYYTNYTLTSGEETSLTLYCSSGAQYSWLAEFAGQTVTFALAPCNWNAKDPYKGAILFAQKADGTRVYNTLNFDNN